jgi:hypothetical protein
MINSVLMILVTKNKLPWSELVDGTLEPLTTVPLGSERFISSRSSKKKRSYTI